VYDAAIMPRVQAIGLRVVQLIAFLAPLLALGSALASPPDVPIDDGRDHDTLFLRHPVNRQLAAQLAAADQDFRMGRDFDRWAFAADLSIGTEQTFESGGQARFHGYYLADTYFAVHVLDGLDANLNLLLFNPSASDGYRVSSQVNAGLALHAWVNLFDFRNAPLRLDVFGTDLGWVTFGAGLLLEQVPLEGVTGRLTYRELGFTYSYIGRALWSDDDVIRTELAWLSHRVGLMYVDWHKNDAALGGPPVQNIAHFVSAFASVPIPKGFHIAGELAVRPRRGLQTAALARADYLGSPVPWLELHAGYQFRWYAREFGPRDQVIQPTVPFSTPYQEDVYVTNSFEYLGISKLFNQWSHTEMLETRLRVRARLQLFGQGELWSRFASSTDPVVVVTPEGFRAPGKRTELFYRAGFTLNPWAGRPHRVNAFVTNKQVQAGFQSSDLQVRRFAPGTYWLLELQAFL
jgi:hypothetical protein